MTASLSELPSRGHQVATSILRVLFNQKFQLIGGFLAAYKTEKFLIFAKFCVLKIFLLEL